MEQDQDFAARERHTGVDGNGVRSDRQAGVRKTASRRRTGAGAMRDGDRLRGKGEADGV